MNRSFELCESYPALVALPAAFMRDVEAVRRSGAHGLGVDTSFALLSEVTKFRSRARFPALVWRDARTGVSVTRCSQPCAGINHSKRSAADERLLESIALSALPGRGRGGSGGGGRSGSGGGGGSRSSSGDALTAPRLQIIDARPKLNALANQGKGKGFEFCSGALDGSDRGTMMDNVASKVRATPTLLPLHVFRANPAHNLTRSPGHYSPGHYSPGHLI